MPNYEVKATLIHSEVKMKTFAVALLAIGVVVLGENVDVGMVAGKFKSGVEGVEFERLESRVKYGDLFDNFSNITANFINDLMVELFRQVRLTSILTSNRVESTAEQIVYFATTEPDVSMNDRIDELLKQLNEHLERFLKLQPGKNNVVSEDLPAIPKLDAEFHHYVTPHSMEGLFTGLTGIIDSYMSSVNVIYNSIFASGWTSARIVMDQFQGQFRSQFLNGYLLRGYGDAVISVNDNAASITSRVKSETWREFATLASRVKVIFDDVKPPLQNAYLKRATLPELL